MKGNIPRAGPKYRLGMYFETIHNLSSFDVLHHDEGGYTSFWETDTEVDSELGNFIFNNVSGDSASLICLDDTIDLLALRKRQQEVLCSNQCKPHYKLEQNQTLLSSAREDHPLERSMDNKHSSHSRQSHRSGSDGTYDHPPPVPPPRRPTTNVTSADFEDHTYETLDDCQDDYMAHQGGMIYISKSDDYCVSMAKPGSNDDTESDHLLPDRNACSGGSCGGNNQVKSASKKTRDSVTYRQRHGSSKSRKRRSEKVASKDSCYPAPVKGFPTGVTEGYADYLALPMTGHLSPERNHTSGLGSPVASHPCQRDTTTGSHDRRIYDTQKSSNSHQTSQSKKIPMTQAPPLVIKHKGKTYLVPLVDPDLEKELEKRSKTNNPTVSIKYQTIGSSSICRANGVYGYSAANNRLHASPTKTEACDYVSPHKRKPSSKSLQHSANAKQVTHYGVL